MLGKLAGAGRGGSSASGVPFPWDGWEGRRWPRGAGRGATPKRQRLGGRSLQLRAGRVPSAARPLDAADRMLRLGSD